MPAPPVPAPVPPVPAPPAPVLAPPEPVLEELVVAAVEVVAVVAAVPEDPPLPAEVLLEDEPLPPLPVLLLVVAAVDPVGVVSELLPPQAAVTTATPSREAPCRHDFKFFMRRLASMTAYLNIERWSIRAA